MNDFDRKREKKKDKDVELLSPPNDNSENNKDGQIQDHSKEKLYDEILSQKFDIKIKKFEELYVDKEIGSKDKRKDTRIIIDKIILENYKSYI